MRQRDEQSLGLYDIRIVTYDELIDNAYAAYRDFIRASESQGKLREVIENIRGYGPSA